ncbi:TPA: hypothetical protein HA244_06445 [Candidatus Micrarchaeota archaeon]|nr:hypothetical protein [Candidatus Micrarchaeota archaeon]
MHMSKTCGTIANIAMVIAGLGLLAYGQGWWNDGMMVHTIAGLLILVYGLAKLMHMQGMCPICKDNMCCKDTKKR